MSATVEAPPPPHNTNRNRRGKASVEIYRPPAARVRPPVVAPTQSTTVTPLTSSGGHNQTSGCGTSSSPTIPRKSPRGNRRKQQKQDRSSCPPEMVPSPSVTRKSVEDRPTSVVNGNDKSNGIDLPENVTTTEQAPLIIDNKQVFDQKIELRDYINNRKQKQDLEIKQLTNTIDMLSNKYFNNSPTPYRQNNDTHHNNVNNQENNRINNKHRNRPDQVLYVPRGRRQQHVDNASQMNYYNRASPLTERYQNTRPSSPAFSIVSEYSGRNRYEGHSRPSSRLSIYDTEDECGNPNATYNRSRETTPGDGNGGRFHRQTMQLIERCVNQESKQNNKNEEFYGRATKSPTPVRDNSKENVLHPVEGSPRRRRSRKNRKRRSQSRDHSNDGNGSTFYNSNYNSPNKYDSGSISLVNSRASSRNASLERKFDEWRKPASTPTSPVKIEEGHRKVFCRTNSSDKPPTGRPDRRNSQSEYMSKIPQGSCPSSSFIKSPSLPHESSERIPQPHLQSELANNQSTNQECADKISSSNSTSYFNGSNNSDCGNMIPKQHQNNEIINSHPTNIDFSETNKDLVKLEEPANSNSNEMYEEFMSLDWTEETEKEEDFPSNINSENIITQPQIKNTPDYSRKSPDYSRKSPEYSRKSPEYSRKSPSFDRQSPRTFQNSPVKSHKISPSRDNRRSPPRQDFYSHPNSFSELKSDAFYNRVDDSTRHQIEATLGRDVKIDQPKKDFSRFENTHRPRLQLDETSSIRTSPPRCYGSPSSGYNSPTSDESGSQSPPSALSHVLELYDFPVSFRTQNLVEVYQPLQAVSPLDVKWVDDTHALVVFANATIAMQALAMNHPQIKSRLLADASTAAKIKAVKIDEELLPVKPRPQTSMMLARRLLSGALGVRVNLTREEREREAKALRQAKDHKKKVAKIREDIWEGNV